MTDILTRLQLALPPRHWLEVRGPVVGPVYAYEADWTVSVRSYGDVTRGETRPTFEEAAAAVLVWLGEP